MGELILASTSPYRRALMERLGLPFRAVAPDVNEERWKQVEKDPRRLAEQLALAKAKSLLTKQPGATLIGSDQVVSVEGAILGKPGNLERAVEQLASMSGRSHLLITAVAILHGGAIYAHTDATTMHLRSLDRQEIERYVAADRPVDCAGSYKLEARGATLFERIETEDYTAILGLPLIAVTSILRRLGFVLP